MDILDLMKENAEKQVHLDKLDIDFDNICEKYKDVLGSYDIGTCLIMNSTHMMLKDESNSLLVLKAVNESVNMGIDLITGELF